MKVSVFLTSFSSVNESGKGLPREELTCTERRLKDSLWRLWNLLINCSDVLNAEVLVARNI